MSGDTPSPQTTEAGQLPANDARPSNVVRFPLYDRLYAMWESSDTVETIPDGDG